MSLSAIAEKDFRDAARSRALWALLAIFVVASALVNYSYVEFPELVSGEQGASVAGLVFFSAGIVSLFVSLTAIVIGYKAVAGERELGSIKLMLALPHTRADVFFGKVVGRTAVLTLALAIGLAIGLGLGLALLGEISIVPILVFLLMTLVFAAIYVAIVVSISATTGSTTRATTLAIGFFLLFELLWDVVPIGIVYVVNGFSLPQGMPDWIFIFMQMPPSSAYVLSIAALLPEFADQAAAQTGAGFDAVYATPEFGFLVLAFWLVVPLAIGYYQFTNADL